MLNSLPIATDGLIGYDYLLTIATRGLIQPEVPADEVIVVVPSGAGFGAYGRTRRITTRRLPERLEPGRDIHRDDQEVLEILLNALLNGIID